MSDSWKKDGGKRVNSIIDSTKDITNKYYSTDPTIANDDKEGVYFYKENAPSIIGFGTKTPYSRVSFGDYNVNNLDSYGNDKDEKIVNNASVALSEKADGSNATGISFYRDGTNSSETRGIRFTVNNNKNGTVAETSLERNAKKDTNTSLMLLNDGTSQKVLINSATSLFSNTGTGLEVNGDIHLTKNLVFDINQNSGDVIKKAGTLFYDGRSQQMKWITGTGADIHTIQGINDAGFAIDSSKYDASFSVITSGTIGFLAFKDLGLCIGNGEMLTNEYIQKFGTNTKQNLPALSILGHHQNGVASNANVLISNISNVTGEAILSKTSHTDLSANGVIYLLNNITIDKYEPEAVIDVSKINVPFLSMGSEITNYYNSVVIGQDISGSSNSFYFGKDIYNKSSHDSSFNFIFGETITISKSDNFKHNLIFGSNLDVSGNYNLVFGQNLAIGPDVSFCMLLGNGTGSAQKGDLIKYFENGTSVFNLKSGGNLILTGDISANDASFNNVVFNNLGNETSKIKLAYVKGLSAENISIENSLTISGKFNSTSDISANDASFNNIDINNLKSYGDFIINGNIDTTGYANFSGDISANDASFNNIDINNLKTYGNTVINGNIDTTGYANFGGDISANDASFNKININIGHIKELKNVQTIDFNSTSNLLIQRVVDETTKNIVTINQYGMLIGGELDAISLKIDGKVFDTTASSSWASGNSKKYTGTSNGLYIPIKVGVNFDAPSANKLSFFPKFQLDVSGVIRSQNQVFGHLSIDLVPQPLSGYTNTITNSFYGSGIYDASENVLNANPVWKLFDNSANTYWESTGSEETVVGISGGDVSITGKYLEIKLPERCTLKHYAFKSSVAAKLPSAWTIIGKIGVDDEVFAANTWKVIDYKTESVQYGADGEFVYFTIDNLKYSNDMYKVFRIYITETFNGTTVGTPDVNQCQISELKLFGEPGNITDISSSLIQTELFDISGALFKQKHLSLQPLGGNVGIRNNNPSVILDISASNAIRLPMGNILERPSPANASGCLRYNTETKQFEGYGDAGWAGLGGVIDKNQDTYIAAEENTDEDMLRFYTKNVERMVINANGVVDVSGLLQSKEISGNSVNATLLKTDGLIINNKTIALNNITDSDGFHVNSKVGYFDVGYDSNYYINNTLQHAIYAYPGSILQFNLDVVGHSFNIFKGRDNSITGTMPNGLQHVDENGTITKVSSVHNKTSGTLMWFVPYDVIGEYRYQSSADATKNGNINILPRPSDISANDISGGHVFANSLRSNGMVINGDISGNTGKFANGIINNQLGIGTSTPLVALDIIGTDAIRIPVGNDTPVGSGGQKPNGADGMIRYNIVSNQFEGYGSGAWAGLGGVIDKDLDTKIMAEFGGNDEDKLRFYTEDVERMIITDSDNSGNIGIHTSNPSVTLDISSNNAIRLPMGNTNARPSPAYASGCLRYNTDTKQFEGYGEGSWGGLGGVISINMDTKITAEDAGGLTFFTDGQKRMNIDDGGNIDISSAVTINNNLDLSGNLDCSSAVIEILTSDRAYVKDLSCSDLDISGILKTDGLIINNKTIALNNTPNSDGFHVNSKVGYFDVVYDSDYYINNILKHAIYAYPGSILQFNLDVVGHPFNIFKGRDESVTGTMPNGLQHVDENGTITKVSSVHNKTSGTLMWFVPYDVIGEYRYQSSTDATKNGNINILPRPSDISANDISGGHVFANTLTIAGDLSGNNALFHDISVNRLWIGDVEMIGHIPGDVSAPTNTGTLTGNMVFNGDMSGNDASFNVVDVKQLSISESSLNLGSGGGGDIKYVAGKFQGHNGSKWIGLGGVISDNEQVYIDASDNSGLTFYTSSDGLNTVESMRILNNGQVNIGGITNVESAIDLKANIANPTFTGTVSGITPIMIGLGSVDDESKATMFANPTFTGTVFGITSAMVGLGYVDNQSKTTMFASPSFTGTVSGITPIMIGLGSVDDESKATMFANPTFTGTVSGITPIMIGLGSVANQSKATMFASPTFTGTVSGITPDMVGLGSVANQSKATMFTNPTFTGTFEAGSNNNANGNNSVAMGASNSSNDYAVAMGASNQATGVYSFAGGYNNNPNASMSVCIGRTNIVEQNANYSVAIGLENRVATPASGVINGCVALGHRAYVGGDIRFAVGVGTDAATTDAAGSTDNNNKFVIDKDGNVGIGTDSPSEKLTISINSTSNTALGLYNGNGSNVKNNGAQISFGYAGTNNWNHFIHTRHNAANFMNAIDFYVCAGTSANNTVTTGSVHTMSLVSGNVGIGTTSPSFPLEIVGFTGAGWGNGTHHYGLGSIFTNTTTGIWYAVLGSPDIGLKVDSGIWSSYNLFSSSDKRIKENIRDVSDNVALQQLRDVSCCFYEYKDKISKGPRTTIGFIAQQVREHFPMAVSLQKNIIPNELRDIQNPQWTTMTDASGNNKYKLTIADLEDASGNTKYKFYVSNDPSGNDECEKEITSLENEPTSFIFEEQWQNVFLYGKEIHDFHTLDKATLFALNFSATQEIDRIQQQEKAKLATAEAKITNLEAKLEEQTTKLTNLIEQLKANNTI